MKTESIISENELYQPLISELEQVLSGQYHPSEIYRRVCTLLRAAIPHYTWVGIYLLEGNLLRLKAWDGPAPTEHTEIEVGQGICGAAAKTGETEIVPDVSADPRHLRCFLSTRSEIVVPIKDSKHVFGEIDIDSDALNAFTFDDKKFLESVATGLLPVVTS